MPPATNSTRPTGTSSDAGERNAGEKLTLLPREPPHRYWRGAPGSRGLGLVGGAPSSVLGGGRARLPRVWVWLARPLVDVAAGAGQARTGVGPRIRRDGTGLTEPGRVDSCAFEGSRCAIPWRERGCSRPEAMRRALAEKREVLAHAMATLRAKERSPLVAVTARRCGQTSAMSGRFSIPT